MQVQLLLEVIGYNITPSLREREEKIQHILDEIKGKEELRKVTGN